MFDINNNLNPFCAFSFCCVLAGLAVVTAMKVLGWRLLNICSSPGHLHLHRRL